MAAAINAKPAALPGVDVFGDGSDGAPVFDGISPVLGMVPDVRAYTLTRDLDLSGATIAEGVTIRHAGFRIYCNGTLPGGFLAAIRGPA